MSDMLQNDVIEPAVSLWALNLVLVRKENGQLRLYAYYHQLNLQIYKDSYPLPRIETCLDSLRGSRFFSSLDLRSGYWQAALDPGSADKTAFVNRRGTFRFKSTQLRFNIIPEADGSGICRTDLRRLPSIPG